MFHLAANADVRFGTDNPSRDLEQNTIGTFNVLEAMRLNKVTKIAFSSTGSVYGDSKIIPTPEDAPFPIQTSLYAASKLASEGLVAAYCEGFDFKSWVFRFVSILGERYTHGHVYDFFNQLGTTVEIKNEKSSMNFWATSAMMAPFYELLKTLSGWLVKRGIKRNEAQKYITSLFVALSEDSAINSKKDLKYLVRDSQTPRGLNEQAVKQLRKAGFYRNLEKSLNGILKRLNKV